MLSVVVSCFRDSSLKPPAPYRFSDTAFGHALEWDVTYSPLREHARSGDHVHQSGGGHPPRLIYQQIKTALYILGASGGGAKEHTCHSTPAMVPFGSIHGLSGFWFILQDSIFTDHPNISSSSPRKLAGKRYSQAVFGFSAALRSLC